MGRVVSNEPSVFALAMCAAFGNQATRTMALEAIPEVARDCGEPLQFKQYLESTRGQSPDAAQEIQRGGEREAVARLHAAVSHSPPSWLARVG